MSSGVPISYLASASSPRRFRNEACRNLRVSRLQDESLLDPTPKCARGLEWDEVLDYRSQNMLLYWEAVTPPLTDIIQKEVF